MTLYGYRVHLSDLLLRESCQLTIRSYRKGYGLHQARVVDSWLNWLGLTMACFKDFVVPLFPHYETLMAVKLLVAIGTVPKVWFCFRSYV